MNYFWPKKKSEMIGLTEGGVEGEGGVAETFDLLLSAAWQF